MIKSDDCARPTVVRWYGGPHGHSWALPLHQWATVSSPSLELTAMMYHNQALGAVPGHLTRHRRLPFRVPVEGFPSAREWQSLEANDADVCRDRLRRRTEGKLTFC